MHQTPRLKFGRNFVDRVKKATSVIYSPNFSVRQQNFNVTIYVRSSKSKIAMTSLVESLGTMCPEVADEATLGVELSSTGWK